MDKNLILAVSLSVAVYATWFGFFEKKLSPPSVAPLARKMANPPSAIRPPAGKTPAAPSAPAQAEAEPAPSREALENQAERITLNGSEVLIHPRGAALVSYRYHGPLGVIELIENPHPGFFATWPGLEFKRVSGKGVVFSATRPDGMRILKEFVPETGSLLPRLRITLANPTAKPLDSGPWTISIGPGLGTIASEAEENQKLTRAIGLTFGEGGSRGKVEQFKAAERGAGSYRWVAVDNRYFLAAAVFAAGDFETVSSAVSPPALSLGAAASAVQPGSQRIWEIPFYVGAKGQTWLTRYQADLERSIDFGFFSQLGRMILRVLYHIQALTGNWGWSIILLTILLQICLFPLTYKSLKAAAAMKRLQPEIAKLQQKFSKDPGRLNTEMMELYKKTGANPLGGCLPMLLQMPIFIALFNALRNAWELHGARWVFWVKDLSSKDPYYVLPLVMGALMFAQNKLNPPTADPAQAKMMTWMPIIFTFMFLNFPSGLVLYWLTNSAVSALQQLILKKRFEAA